jgi:hypothetical protein
MHERAMFCKAQRGSRYGRGNWKNWEASSEANMATIAKKAAP